MSPMEKLNLILRLLPAILSVACSSSTDSKSTPVDWAVGRGSTACQEWQQAFCELESKCGTASVSTCAGQLQTVSCTTDTAAANCASSIAAASCSSFPSGCNVTDIADTAAAVQACADYLTAGCTHDANCGSTTAVDTCVANLQTSLSCSKAIGVKLNYESCMTQIRSAGCGSALPAECTSLIYVSS